MIENWREIQGPFDLIGDIHGCADELELLLQKLGYEWETIDAPTSTYHRRYQHPAGRRVIFLGDLVDRGPRILDSYQIARHMVEAGHALCVPGNHDAKLMRQLEGRPLRLSYGLEMTLAEIEALPDAVRQIFRKEMATFIRGLPLYLILDHGRLVAAHAGLKEEFHGQDGRQVRSFVLFGDTTGQRDEHGLPIRRNWAAAYQGQAAVVYGHTPVTRAEWFNNTINIDTGCVFGGHLTALRYPEREIMSIPAQREYVRSPRGLDPPPHEQVR